MIENVNGNLLLANTEALVNAVNCVGVMGKGVALQFKQAWPAMAKDYERLCHAGQMQPGKMHVWETHAPQGPKFLINFPTKRNWRHKSRYEDIESGLSALTTTIRERSICSIALPALGCGAGGLSWAKVRPMVESAFTSLEDVLVLLFAPGHEPASKRA